MLTFDDSQLAVLDLDTTRHARVLGAPGSGKTRLIIESVSRLLDVEGWDDSEVLVMAANRQVAGRVRAELEECVPRAIGSQLVRTGVGFAFAVLQAAAARDGAPAPRLLTGTAQNELLADRIEEALSVASDPEGQRLIESFSREVLRSEVFRTELREYARVLDDFSLDPASLTRTLRDLGRAPNPVYTQAPSEELLRQWLAVLPILERYDAHLSQSRAGEKSSSQLLREATEFLRSSADFHVPRLILIDDAHELREGELALLSACVLRGARVWLFGDPDIATGAFQGDHTQVMSAPATEFRRKLREAGITEREASLELLALNSVQSVVLERVYRHGPRIREFVQSLTERIGAAGVGQQRAALSHQQRGADTGRVQFVAVPSFSEQIGGVAHRLRQRRLGLEAERPISWKSMAVVCRSRAQATKVARLLASAQVPTESEAGGLVLRAHAVVHHLVSLLGHALGTSTLTAAQLSDLLTGTLGGLDQISLRRLRGELKLREVRRVATEGGDPRRADDLLMRAFLEADTDSRIDSAGGRALHRLTRAAEAAVRTNQAGGTPREVLWALWDSVGIAKRLQKEALANHGLRSDEAHRTLDAVQSLFFVLQRHEEQGNERPIAEVLDHAVSSTVPEDTLAARSRRDAVLVTTPQGVIGREFDLVCILGPQDGEWPNLRTRGSLLGVTALERWLRGMEAAGPDRRDTLHDELRLYVHACARARDELLAVAVRDEQQHPSPFFGMGASTYGGDTLPTSRLTLRGAVAEMRRRLTRDPSDKEALSSLVALARHGVAGAHPEEWYGVRELSSDAPLVNLDEDPEAVVLVRPSHIETAERCPLSWVISHLGGGSSNALARLGTILHSALEQAEAPDSDRLIEIIDDAWPNLEFESAWESATAKHHAELMARGLAEYLAEFEQSDRQLVGREVQFTVRADRALLVGVADRLESRRRSDGTTEMTVVDLKSGKKKPSKRDREAHAQMQAYQLGVTEQAFDLPNDPDWNNVSTGGARLLFVHPGAVGKANLRPEGYGFTETTQAPLDSESREQFIERVGAAARIMAGHEFDAKVEHHCSDEYAVSRFCSIHIVPAVSRA